MCRNRHRDAFGRLFAVFFVVAASLSLPAVGRAQDPADEAEEQLRPPTIFDFIDYEVRDPQNLQPPARKFQDRWRRIWGALGMRYHLYPSQATGPDNWPPHLYAGGTNYSIWRNPVTGWPDF